MEKLNNLLDKLQVELDNVDINGHPLFHLEKVNEIVGDIRNMEKENYYDSFREAANPMLKYLNDHHHPHVTAIITPTSIELV